MEPAEKLQKEIHGFLETYKTLPPEGRASFEAVINKNLRDADAKTAGLYRALIRAAQNNATVEAAIEELHLAAGQPSVFDPQ
ncbi:MAG: hypothetical protein WCW67_04825 [Candidatus Margulisiibacteriota bacterium]|jgi:hypothetical protein